MAFDVASVKPNIAGLSPFGVMPRFQLGLKLESAKAPLDVLVIDSVQHPTEN
jgi:hypothetical protein